MSPKMLLIDLLDLHPAAEDVFEDYGVPVDDMDLQLSVAVFCRSNGLDVQDLLAEVAALSDSDVDDDDDDEDWIPKNARYARH